MDFELEICCNSLNSALEAQKGGATRIELCDNMAEGGTTPSPGLISACRHLLKIPVFPIIRPRGGDFLYNTDELRVMRSDISFCKESGCKGVVLGILNSDGTVNMEVCRELIDLARPMEVTFHRAFDRCRDLEKGLEQIIELGCERLLTSGAEVTAINAVPTLASLVKQAATRIMIMAGSGINENNIASIFLETGVRAYHSTAKTIRQSKMNYLGSGKLAQLDGSFPIMETSAEKVMRMKNILTELQTC